MIATRAKHRFRSICALFLLALGACGGRSVHHDEDPASGAAAAEGDDDSEGSATPSSSKECRALCGQCSLDTLVGARSCEDFCAEAGSQAVAAACEDLYEDLVGCRAKSANACSLTACPAQTNAFSVCVLSYCDDHPYRMPLCTAW